MESERLEIRERVLCALAVMAHPELASKTTGRLDQIGFELCRVWFEHVFVPGLWTVDGLKGNRAQKEVNRFWQAFDEDERQYLERFNRFIELRLEMTPEQLKHARSIDADRWSGIARDARNTLQLIEPGFEVSRSRISDTLRLGDVQGR